MNKLIVMLGCAVIGAASIAGLTQARQSEPAARQERPSGAVNVRPHQAFSFDLGSKKAVGYFTSDRAACGLTLMLAENVDLEKAAAIPTAAQVRVTLGALQSTEVQSEEAGLTITCSAGGESIALVQSSKPEPRQSAR